MEEKVKDHHKTLPLPSQLRYNVNTGTVELAPIFENSDPQETKISKIQHSHVLFFHVNDFSSNEYHLIFPTKFYALNEKEQLNYRILLDPPTIRWIRYQLSKDVDISTKFSLSSRVVDAFKDYSFYHANKCPEKYRFTV